MSSITVSQSNQYLTDKKHKSTI